VPSIPDSSGPKKKPPRCALRRPWQPLQAQCVRAGSPSVWSIRPSAQLDDGEGGSRYQYDRVGDRVGGPPTTHSSRATGGHSYPRYVTGSAARIDVGSSVSQTSSNRKAPTAP